MEREKDRWEINSEGGKYIDKGRREGGREREKWENERMGERKGREGGI